MRRLIVSLLLLSVLGQARSWHKVTIAELASGNYKLTHIEVTGTVMLVKRELDGDLHIRISDGSHFIIAECIPALPCQRPQVGDVVTVRGISRWDGMHHWAECHPVERLTIQRKEHK